MLLFCVIASTFLGAVANLPGDLISIVTIKHLGRGRTLGARNHSCSSAPHPSRTVRAAISMVLSSISVFGALAIKSASGVVALLCIFSGISVAGLLIRATPVAKLVPACTAWNALNIVTTECVDSARERRHINIV